MMMISSQEHICTSCLQVIPKLTPMWTINGQYYHITGQCNMDAFYAGKTRKNCLKIGHGHAEDCQCNLLFSA